MKACKVEALLTDYFYGEAEGSDRARMEAHLSGCPSCKKALEELRLVAAGSRPAAFPGLDSQDWDGIRVRAQSEAQVMPPPFQREGMPEPLSGWITGLGLPGLTASLAAAALVLSLSHFTQQDALPFPREGKGGDMALLAHRPSNERVVSIAVVRRKKIRNSRSGEKEMFIPVDGVKTAPKSELAQVPAPARTPISEKLPIEPVGSLALSNANSPAVGNPATAPSNALSAHAAARQNDSPSPLQGEGRDGVLNPSPRSLILRHNRINPSLGEKVTLTLNLPKSGRLLVRIFDPAGALVVTLADAETPAGDAEFSWSGQNTQGQTAASGIYFLSVDGPGLQEREKILVLK